MVSNSRFVTSLAPANSVEEARDFIKLVKEEFKDANHHVPVFLIGYGDSVTAHCSDAGEPSGTAGRPALAVLQGSGLGDVVVVITRYFGGTKLGTGGLVRAYSDAVRAVLEKVDRAARVMADTIVTTYSYIFLERVRQIVQACRGTILSEDFSVNVTLTARFPSGKLELFQKEIAELTSGKVIIEIIDSALVLIPWSDIK